MNKRLRNHVFSNPNFSYLTMNITLVQLVSCLLRGEQIKFEVGSSHPACFLSLQ